MKYAILTLIVMFFVLTANSQSTDGDNLFDDSFLHTIRFESADTNHFITKKKYQQLNMLVDGNTVDSVGFKRKGNISAYYSPNKLAIKIKTNKYVSGKKYDGIKEFTLHMNYQDPSMMREKLTYDICAQMGLFSLRAAFAKVYINDVYWGLYTIVEGKDEMYNQVFDNRDMDAVESLDFGDMCYISDNPTDYDTDNNGGNPTYELENGDELTAWPKFATMISKANNTANNNYLDTVSKHLNLEDFFTYQAVNVYLMNMDSYISFKGNQIYIYDTTASLWQVAPWDFNASFGLWNTNNSNPTTYEIIPNAISNGCIAGKLNNVPELKTYYLNAMCKLNSTIGDTNNYFSRIDELKSQIQQAVYDDTRKHITNDDFDNAVGYGFNYIFGENQPALKSFISQRLEVITQGLVDENYDCQSIGITEVPKGNSVKIFPNPVNSNINIDLESSNIDVKEISIINSLGQAVRNYKEPLSKINVEDLKSGLYILVIIDGKTNYTSKFLKQ